MAPPDHLSPEERSTNMSRIRGKDTGPEWVVRRLLWSMGYRYRLHKKGLPGKPDIVISRLEAVVFVHGCYWHRHPGCARGRSTPATRTEWWQAKFDKNVERDERNRAELQAAGWTVITVWGCETKKSKLDALRDRLGRELAALDAERSLPEAAEDAPDYG